MATIEVPDECAGFVVGFLLAIEMGYDDYSPLGQATPSCVEELVFATAAERDAAERAVDRWIDSDTKYPGIMTCYPVAHPVLVPKIRTYTPADAVATAQDMYDENYGPDGGDSE